MPDVVSPAVRSRMMSGIKASNTRPELLVRHNLHRLGFRYNLHDRKLPGTPDLAFPQFRAVIFVHGCFWHGHDCHLFKMPATRSEFWQEKIERNRFVDIRSLAALNELNWRCATVWECALKGRGKRPLAEVISSLAHWLKSGNGFFETRGISDAARPPV